MGSIQNWVQIQPHCSKGRIRAPESEFQSKSRVCAGQVPIRVQARIRPESDQSFRVGFLQVWESWKLLGLYTGQSADCIWYSQVSKGPNHTRDQDQSSEGHVQTGQWATKQDRVSGVWRSRVWKSGVRGSRVCRSRVCRSGVWNFRVQSSGSWSLAFPVSEFHNMVIHEGNEHRESSNESKFGDPEFGGSEFWESRAQSLVFPISEFHDMVIHKGNKHREGRNKSQRLDIQDSSSRSGWRWSLDIRSSEFWGSRARSFQNFPSQSFSMWNLVFT